MPARKKMIVPLGSISQQWFACFFFWDESADSSMKLLIKSAINCFMRDGCRFGYWWLIELCVCASSQQTKPWTTVDMRSFRLYVHTSSQNYKPSVCVCLTFWRIFKKQLHGKEFTHTQQLRWDYILSYPCLSVLNNNRQYYLSKFHSMYRQCLKYKYVHYIQKTGNLSYKKYCTALQTTTFPRMKKCYNYGITNYDEC